MNQHGLETTLFGHDRELLVRLRHWYVIMRTLLRELREANALHMRYRMEGNVRQLGVTGDWCRELQSQLMEVKLNIQEIQWQRAELRRLDAEIAAKG